MTTIVYKRRRWLLWGLVLVVGLGLLGYVGTLLFPAAARLVRPAGVVCVYHGAKSWLALRHGHPLWSGLHLWRATHDCHRTPWRF